MKRVVFTGGTILSGTSARSCWRAVAVENGKIVAVDDEALQGGGDSIDLAGKTLVPGFHDGHIHPVFGGPALIGAPIREAKNLEELLSAIGNYANANPDLAWIRGFGYYPALVPDGYGDATVLDQVAGDRPVALTASDGHTMWVNTAALTAAGINMSTDDPVGGTIVRRPDGSPVGALLEAAKALVESVMPPYTLEERRKGVMAALVEMARAGITWGQDAWAEPEDVDLLIDLASSGPLPCRLNVAMVAKPGEWQAQVDAMLAAREDAALAGTTDWVAVRTIKFFADGIIETGTASMLEPYCDDAASRGIPNWSDGELSEAMTTFDSLGFQIHIHAIGDAGIRSALDAIDQSGRTNGQLPKRPVIAHTQLVDPHDLPRFAQLGVIANFEPLWACLDPIMVDLTLPRLGEERSVHQYPIASIFRSQAAVSLEAIGP